MAWNDADAGRDPHADAADNALRGRAHAVTLDGTTTRKNASATTPNRPRSARSSRAGAAANQEIFRNCRWALALAIADDADVGRIGHRHRRRGRHRGRRRGR